ncbi:MAG TPA: TonB-dependent receptor [Sphingobium sp.]|nr:TonB-dependent receptor [Sphingobium sp.]
MTKKHISSLLIGASVLVVGHPATAQSVDGRDAAETGEDAGDRAIVITGSRIVRTGAQEPTPVTIVQVEDLVKAAPTNIPDALNQLPQFQGSRSAAGGTGDNTLSNANTPRSGNYLNLRNVGSQRMLVLLDGRRVPPTSFEGIVDTNVIPQSLVRQVDVVTAGASAVYGADAVSGVVNFVLDKRFEGLKASVQSGITEYGDNFNWRASIAGGTSFAGGRGHIVASYDYYASDGIPRKNMRPDLMDPVYFQTGTGTAADPYRTVTNARGTSSTTGGLITGVSNPVAAGQLMGLQFLGGEDYRPIILGAPTQNANVRIGGEGVVGYPDTVLVAGLKTHQVFGHARYEVTDNTTIFAQASYAWAQNQYDTLYDNRTGAAAFQIFSDNPYLPDGISQIMRDTGTASFSMGRLLTDLPVYATDTRTESWIATAGAEGSFEFLKNGRWDLYYTYGSSTLDTSQLQNENRNLLAAVDAVDEGEYRNGVRNGNVVCRVMLVNPGLLPNCTPLNLFGAGSPSQAAIDYVTGYSQFHVRNQTHEVGANFSGALFAVWGGDVSFNIGATYRHKSLAEDSNADPAVPINYTGIRGTPATTPARFSFTNVGVADGSTSSKEAYGELVVPLLSDVAGFRYFELNGAARYTDYDTSGGIWSWKVGGIWEPVRGVRFRVTRSRDIREPTLYDLFAGRQINPSFFTDQGVTNQTLPTILESGGNLNLRPEIGHTTAAGVVLQPAFLPGLVLSVDYYNLKIEDAIGTLGINTVRDQCVESGGASPLCDLIIRPGPITDTSIDNFPTKILNYPINIASLETQGIDIDLGYRLPLSRLSGSMNGTLNFRAISNYLIHYKTNAGAGARTYELEGLVGRSRWRHTVSMNYHNGGFDAFLQARIVGSAQRDTAGNTGYIYEKQKVPAETYFDLSLSTEVDAGFTRFTPFLTVNNLLDNDPPILSSSFSPGVLLPTDSGTYDVMGRRFTFGVRFRM